MDSFTIRSGSGAGAIEFFERTPADPSLRLERFKVRITDLELDATARVYVEGDAPSRLFDEIERTETAGEAMWTSPQFELVLRSARDKAGHVAIEAVSRSGLGEREWEVRASVEAEAGQLPALRANARSFFGRV